MGKIYSYKGNWERLKDEDPKTYSWLKTTMGGEGRDRLESLMGELLGHEFNTRRFDELFMGQLHPQGSEAGFLGAMVGVYMNTNTIVKEVSISEHAMEWDVLDWYSSLFGYDRESYSGNIVEGGTSANLAALWVARERKVMSLRKQGKYKRGQDMVIIAGGMKHYSIDKSARLLGDNILFSPSGTDDFKTSIRDTERILQICQTKNLPVAAIVGLAGETETGLVDDLEGLADLAVKYDTHFHVDAAYGGPFILSKAKDLFSGIDRADSITVDPHKFGYVPYNCAMVLFKDKEYHALIQNKARYLQKEENKGVLGPREERNFGLAARVEGSMGSGGVISAWASMKLFGSEGYAKLLNHGIDLANYAWKLTNQADHIRPLHKPELNGLLIGVNAGTLDPKRRTDLVCITRERLFEETGIYIADTGKLDCGGGCYRTVFPHPFTNEKHIEMMVRNLDRIVAEELIKK
jgi:glutamate/tyrosine decarboxylase-like PLP-dependent enzyme